MAKGADSGRPPRSLAAALAAEARERARANAKRTTDTGQPGNRLAVDRFFVVSFSFLIVTA